MVPVPLLLLVADQQTSDEGIVMLIKDKSEKRSRTHKRMARLVPIVFIGFSVWISLRLISEARYYPATGWIIISIVVSFFLILSLIEPSKKTISGIRPNKISDATSIRNGDQLVLIYSSKDIICISQIEQALRSRGIDCVVLDRHGSVIMSFIPDIEMRIMVPQDRYERSVQIVNELMDR